MRGEKGCEKVGESGWERVVERGCENGRVGGSECVDERRRKSEWVVGIGTSPYQLTRTGGSLHISSFLAALW